MTPCTKIVIPVCKISKFKMVRSSLESRKKVIALYSGGCTVSEKQKLSLILSHICYLDSNSKCKRRLSLLTNNLLTEN